MIQCIKIVVEFFSKVFDKTKLNIFTRSSVIFRFIVKLESDHTFSVCRNFHQFTDHAFRIIAIDRMCDIHNLSCTVNAPSFDSLCKHIRISFHHPCRHRISRSPNDDVDSRFFHRIHHTGHMRKIKDTLLRLACTPR